MIENFNFDNEPQSLNGCSAQNRRERQSVIVFTSSKRNISELIAYRVDVSLVHFLNNSPSRSRDPQNSFTLFVTYTMLNVCDVDENLTLSLLPSTIESGKRVANIQIQDRTPIILQYKTPSPHVGLQ